MPGSLLVLRNQIQDLMSKKERLLPDEPSPWPRYRFNSILNSRVHNFCFNLKKRLLNSGVKDQSFVLFVIFPIETKCPYHILFSKK